MSIGQSCESSSSSYLSEKAKDVLEKYREKFIHSIKFDEISQNLEAEKLIYEREVEELKSKYYKDRNFELWKILFNRCDDDDIDRFCKILIKSSLRVHNRLGEGIQRSLKHRLK